MPLYEYECEGCGRRFEVIQKFSDAPVERCETCGGKVRKLLSSPAIQFKGSGWYITDYARKSSGSGSTGSSDAKTPPDSGAPSAPSSVETSKAADKGGADKSGKDKT